MTRPRLIGTIVDKDGCYCIQTGSNCYYPLNGNSGIAEKFRETFTTAQRGDVGRKLYNDRGCLVMALKAQNLAD